MKIQSYFHLKNQVSNKKYIKLIMVLKKNIEFETNSIFRKSICRLLCNESWSINSKVFSGSKITITASNTDSGIAVQTGNIARIYADLIKLCAMQKNRRIKIAFVLVPCKSLAKKWGSNIANFERVVQELKIFKKVINKPLVVLGVKP